MDKNEYKGYLQFLRAIILLFKDDKGTNFSLLGAYICFVSEADWDFRHKKYKHIDFSNKELADRWNCSETTIWRKVNALKRMNLVGKGLKNMLTVTSLELFNESVARELSKFAFSNKEEFIASSKIAIAEFQKEIAEMKERQVQKSLQSSRISFKDDLGLSDSSKRLDIDYNDFDKWERDESNG